MNNQRASADGSLKISGNAVLKIAETAAAEVEGVALNEAGKLLCAKSIIPFSEMFSSPVKVKLSGDSVVIETSVIVKSGYKAHSVAEAIQNCVKSAVQNMTGIAVSKVNVKIAGIQQPKTE